VSALAPNDQHASRTDTSVYRIRALVSNKKILPIFRFSTIRRGWPESPSQDMVVDKFGGAGLLRPQHLEKGLLRDVDLADAFHAFFAFFLFLQQPCFLRT
jgi:hypothetical protein